MTLVSAASQQLDLVFSALSSPIRRDIVSRLARDSACVTELQEAYDVSLPAISRHLRQLEDAGLIRRVPEGRHRRCVLTKHAMRDAANWIDAQRRFWEETFSSLDAYLRKERKR